VVLVAAAGNDSNSQVGYPAAYPGVLAVGATNATSDHAWYSNFGTGLDLVAPGGDTRVDATGDGWVDGVFSTAWDDQSSPPRGTYTHYQGTSMAAPHVAGVAALVLSVAPDMTPAEVETVLLQTANDLGMPSWDIVFGWGLVDAFRAVTAAMNTGSSPPQLHLDFSTVSLGATETQRDLTITNFGEDPLVVNAPLVTTTDGNAWLSASLLPPNVTSNAAGVRITVDRAGLSPGGYSGDITLSSNGGAWIVHVLMVVVSSLPPLPVLPLRLYVTSVATGQVERFTDIDANHEFTWELRSLPAGQYHLRAGTDLDHDGRYDDDGEYVGAWPTFEQPHILVIQAGQTIPGLRLPIFPKIAVDEASAARTR
jgi:serine protease